MSLIAVRLGTHIIHYVYKANNSYKEANAHSAGGRVLLLRITV